MNTQLVIAMMTLLACLQGVAKAAIPAHNAAPAQYQVLFENDQVLTLKMTLAANEQDKWHSHHSETVYFQRGGTLAIETEHGVQEVTVADGEVMWHPSWRHRVTNLSAHPVVAIIVEQKPQ
ncbi:hypothetical protein MHM93_18420 [Pseudoalteromonas sp. MM17-2]|uniref:hypothetical protein n=1 Tax=Pseudoalteromonas sp. MM17-2 TaxID=2917753 RepID=UPI001EF3DFA4|nr:hypothetical protein [Pseudoalteromonas sp. MM17-2]MCG7546151.1 hypothetical protein [Pseudoalteromonas sp. MM17-2]